MTAVDLPALKAKLDDVEGLPWTLHGTSTLYMDGKAAYFTRHDGKPGQRVHLTCHQAEAELIVAAVNALPELLAFRCASCDHDIALHQEDGCWFTVESGKPGSNLVCVCAVSRSVFWPDATPAVPSVPMPDTDGMPNQPYEETP